MNRLADVGLFLLGGGEDVVARPKKIDTTVVRKLEHGFLNGLSDREACLFANIAPSTLYEYCKENPEFSERKELLKDQVKLKAKSI